MKAKVIMPFNDKVTKKAIKPGDIIDVTEERYAEIVKKGRFVEKVKEKAAPAVKAEK